MLSMLDIKAACSESGGIVLCILATVPAAVWEIVSSSIADVCLNHREETKTTLCERENLHSIFIMR